MKFQGSPIKTNDLSKNTYIYFSCIALKYLATLWWNILLRLGNVGLSTFWLVVRRLKNIKVWCKIWVPLCPWMAILQETSDQVVYVEVYNLGSSVWKKRILGFIISYGYLMVAGKHLSAGGSVWVDAPCPGGLRLSALPTRSDGDPWAVALGLSWCSTQGRPSRAHAVSAAPEQEETSTQFVQGAAHPVHRTSVLGPVCKALSGALAGTGLLSKEGK